MERQIESPSAYPRLFNEESWRDLLPEAVHGPLKTAAAEFFQDTVGTLGDSSQESFRERELSVAFYDGLNSGVVDNLGDTAINLSQAEADYGALFLKLAATPSGSGRDGLLRDLALAREKLVRKEELAPATTVARSLAEKIGWRGAVGKLQPGSSGERLQAIERVVLQKLGYQDLRSLFESQARAPLQVLEKFMGGGIEVTIHTGEKDGLTEDDVETATPEAELSKNIFGKISRWLKGVNWKFVGKGSAAMLGGIGLAELLKFSLFTESLMGSVLVGVNLLLRKVRGAERVEAFIKSREVKYPHASERLLNRVVMATATGELRAVRNALRVVESPEAMFVGLGISLDAGARSIIAAVGARQLLETRQAAGAGAGGELPGGGGLPPRSDWVEEARAQGWPSAEQRFQAGGGAEELRAQGWQQLGGQPPGEEPPVVLSPQAGELVNRAGEVAEQEAREMADAAQGAAEHQRVVEAATRVVEVQPGDTLTGLIDAAGGDAYGKDFTDTVLRSADVLTGPQNPNRDMAQALIEFIKAHPDGVNWRDAINGVGDLAKEMVGGVPLKDAIAQATRMIYPGQEMKIVVGAGIP